MYRVAIARKTPYLFALIIFMISCKNDLKISVFEPLPTTIVQKYSQEDSAFLTFYNDVRKLADSVFISTSVSPEFSSLEYNSMTNFKNDFTKEFESLKSDRRVKDNWHLKFGKDIDAFKSDSLKFRNYILENDYHNFLEIEVSKIYEKTVWVSQYTMVYLIFTPKNGNGIRKVAGYVYFLPKEEKFDSLKSYHTIDKKVYFSFSGHSRNEFKDSAIETHRKLSDLVDLPIEIIKQKYNVYFNLIELVTDEKYIDVAFEKVPYEMKEVLRGEYDFYSDAYITAHLNKSYKYFNQYVNDSAFSLVKQTYPLEAKFFEEGWNRYNEAQSRKFSED